MSLVHHTLSDIRFAARSFRRRPMFTLVAASTLALGVATATAMFTLLNGIVLRPLPYARADRLVEVMQSYPEKKLDRWTLSQENVGMYLGAKSFDQFAAYARTGLTLDGDGQAERIIAEIITGNFFSVLGAKPLLGRLLGPADDKKGSNDAVVISYAFWQSRFGGSSQVVGKTLQIGGQPARIVGVLPPGFSFPKPDVQLYLAIGLDPTRAHPNFLTGVARLRDRTTVDQAAHDATSLMWDWARRSPGMLNGTPPERTQMRVLLTPLRTAIAGSVEKPLVILQAAVALILLIAIANVATLIAARGLARGREIAMRAALGATRQRLIGQLMTESLALAALGGSIGVLAAAFLVRGFTHSSLATLPRVEEVSVDTRVLVFAVVISAISGVLFGVLPALSLDVGGLAPALAGQKSSASQTSRKLNNLLIAGQVMLSFVLLIGAGLLLKSFQRLLHTDLGFNPAGVQSVTLALPQQRYARANQPRAFDFVERLAADASAQPGFRGAAVMFPAMYVNDVNSDGFVLDGQDPNAPPAQTVQYAVSPGLFRTLQIPLLAGRDFEVSDDRADGPPVVVVDQALLGRSSTPSAAVGKRVRMTGDTIWRTIIGVVGSIRDEGVADASRPHTYFPFSQYGGTRPTLVVRSDADASAVLRTVKRAIAAIDPGVPVDVAHPIAAAIGDSLATRRMTQLLLIAFAALALILTAGGLYGVMSMYVASRTREFGIRAAVGANPSELLRSVLAEAAGLVAAGSAVGILFSLAGGRWLHSLLYQVTPTDPLIYMGVAAVLVGVTFASCYAPARRAAGVDPLLALRAD